MELSNQRFRGCKGIKQVEQMKTESQQDGSTAGAEDFKNEDILARVDFFLLPLKATHGLTSVNWLWEQRLCCRNFPGGE